MKFIAVWQWNIYALFANKNNANNINYKNNKKESHFAIT